MRSALASILPVTITIYNEQGNENITGYVIEIDSHRKRIGTGENGRGDECWRWIPFDDIIGVEFDHTDGY
nr:YolD-like family protein [Paenibacillus periandrae]